MILTVLVLACGWGAPGPQETPPPKDLTELSIEDLLKLDVTSVSKGNQKLMDVPAAVTVIRGEDLRRTGVTTFPDALRSVPGIHVASVNSGNAIVASRGFSDLFANKLLVMIDGRSVYTPLFSGVFWGNQDAFFEDIDRIEVIRGPGATVWGANAVNGVINIITKPAKDTQGEFLYAGGGTHEQGFGGARSGGRIGDDVHYRAYGKYWSRDDYTGGTDDSNGGQGGFRTEWTPGKSDEITLQGDLYSIERNNRQRQVRFLPLRIDTFDAPTFHQGANLLTRWEHDFSETSRFEAQAYWDRFEFDSPYLAEVRNTVDLDLQHRFRLLDGHDVTWGLGYRWTRGHAEASESVSLDPETRIGSVWSTFLQDEIKILDVARLWLGSKFEYNNHTGYEYQPGVRLSLQPHDQHTVWLSAARAVRTPSQAEDDVTIRQTVDYSGAFPALVTVRGDSDFNSEELIALEAGYRSRPFETLSFDLAGFYNIYDDLVSAERGAVDTTPLFTDGYVIQPITFENKLEGVTYGFEFTASWQASDWLRFQASYSFIRIHLDAESDSTDARRGEDVEGSTPRGMASLRASIDPAKDVDVDLIGRWVSRTPEDDIDAYFELDARIAWQFHKRAELALVGQNLLHDSHEEAGDSPLGNVATEPKRGVYLSLSVKF
jgi:iron complex outermembrane receptor protein